VVPSCWNNELRLYDYEGVAWYTTGFEFVLTDVDPGIHTLTVMVDSAPNDKDTIPLTRVDWKHNGGIFRSGEIMELDDIWIDDVKVDYTLDKDKKEACIKAGIAVRSTENMKKKTELKVYEGVKEIYSREVEINNDNQKIEIENIRLEGIKLWDIESPNLYELTFQLAGDDITERIVFNEVKEFVGKKILFLLAMSTMMIPFSVRLIPLFIIMSDLHLINNFIGMIIPVMAASALSFIPILIVFLFARERFIQGLTAGAVK
jgi:beta-glucuronidase